jgi:hypothetical protein
LRRLEEISFGAAPGRSERPIPRWNRVSPEKSTARLLQLN